jgi:biofilm protein TabA
MILDRLENADRYTLLHPGFERGIAFARRAMTERLEQGKYEIDGERLFVIVADDQGKGRAGAKLEVHRRYIDIQVCLPSFARSGSSIDRQQDGGTNRIVEEQIGWRPLADCRNSEADFNDARDIQFFLDRPDTWLALPPGVFAIFYPDDVHAPLAGEGLISKAVVKVAVHW